MKRTGKRSGALAASKARPAAATRGARKSGPGPQRKVATKTASPAPAKRGRPRSVPEEARREAILRAALAVFAEHGFEAARLDEVAARAGVAKGTLYLYFRHKEALFEALIRSSISPVMDLFDQAASAPELSPLEAIDTFFALFEKEVLGTPRKLLLRLIIAEGARFPAIAEIYHREVVVRGLGLLRTLAERGARQGAFATSAPARHPQLIVAPLLVALIWDALFGKIDPLNVGALLRGHREVLIGKPRKGAS